MPIEHHLQVNDSGHLFLPLTDENRGSSESMRDEDQLILLHIYPEGDCDYCNWPFESEEDKKRLAYTLFDEGNMDRLQPGVVFLPDGEVFGEVVPCGFNPLPADGEYGTGCKEYDEFLKTLHEDPMSKECGCLDDVVQGWLEKHRKTCKVCQEAYVLSQMP